MREESHLDDMRSAIRGDFERLAERRGGQDLMRPREPDDEVAEANEESEPAAAEATVTPAPEASQPAPEPVAEPVEAAVDESPTPVEEPVSDEPRRRGWLDRLLGR